MEPWLLAAASLDLVSTIFFGYLAAQLARRGVSQQARIASICLALFWAGLGAHVATTGMYTMWESFAPVPPAVAASLVNLQSLLLCVFLWGISGYLYYLVTGRYFLITFSILYAAYYLILQYFLISQYTAMVAASDGEIRILFSAPIPTTVGLAVIVAVIGPPIAAAVVYLTLARVAPDRTVLYRVLVVGVALLLWFGPASYYLNAGEIGIETLIVFQSIALVLIALAYFPPGRWRTRYRLLGIEDRWTSTG